MLFIHNTCFSFSEELDKTVDGLTGRSNELASKWKLNPMKNEGGRNQLALGGGCAPPNGACSGLKVCGGWDAFRSLCLDLKCCMGYL